ncbi:hypothetical protein IJJ46_00585 [Candidatus Saccharibacteria bacterium]|nr:hypothetical protein [Candidatus Saccharibacteria bacterium]
MKKRENQSNSAIMGNGDSARKAKSKKSSEKSTRFKAKLLATYYGHPMKDMKLIAVTGTTGKNEVAHLVHEILKSAGQPVAIFAAPGPFKISALYKFLSEAWKAGANYVVVTAPIEALANGTFSELPIHVAALTNYRPARLTYSDETEETYVKSTADEVSPEATFTTPEDYYNATVKLFQNAPDYVVLNHDDETSNKFVDFAGLDGTLFYGSDRTSHIQIMNSKLYKKGVEATLSIGGTRFTVASFLTGEPAISYMACAAAVADALHIAPEKIIDGIANYEP